MLTKETCIEQGGHCWQESQWSTSNGYETVINEYCKHCPAQRKKISQSPWRYEELSDRM